jgi:hypothetical protein
LRDKRYWVTHVVAPALVALITALGVATAQGFWGWLFGPPGLIAQARQPDLHECHSAWYSKTRVLKAEDVESGRAVQVAAPPLGPATLSITLQTENKDSVVVQDAKIRILSKKTPPLEGHLRSRGCVSVIPPRDFGVDLDRDYPGLFPTGESDDPPADFPLKVSSTDPEELLLSLRTTKYDVRFEVLVEWTSAGASGTEVLDNGGKGYRVVSDAKLPRPSDGPEPVDPRE